MRRDDEAGISRRWNLAANYFDPVAGAVDGAVAGEPAPEPVVADGFVELVLVVGALVWFDAVVWLPVL